MPLILASSNNDSVCTQTNMCVYNNCVHDAAKIDISPNTRPLNHCPHLRFLFNCAKTAFQSDYQADYILWSELHGLCSQKQQVEVLNHGQVYSAVQQDMFLRKTP